MLALLWFCWTTFASLGDLVHAGHGMLPWFGFGIMAAAFVLAIAIPQAFVNQPGALTGPVVFAGAYLVLRVLALAAFLYAVSGAGRSLWQLAPIVVPAAVAAVLIGLATPARAATGASTIWLRVLSW